MRLVKSIETITYLDFLIRTRSTGCALELAEKLGVSERTAFNYIGELRLLGAPVSWSGTERSYIYLKKGKIRFYFDSNLPEM